MKRKLWTFENRSLIVQVAPGGGHIAALRLKKGHSPNPLWTPPWKSMEPSAYKPKKHDRLYGGPPEGRLLASILGHNLCMDSFGSPSPAETRAGGLTHGEAGVVKWKRAGSTGFSAKLPGAQLEVERKLTFHSELPIVAVQTRVANRSAHDRPIAWCEHVTFGPPFLGARTEFEIPCRRAMVHPSDLGPDSLLDPGKEFVWPKAPGRFGELLDWSITPATKRVTAFTAQLFETPGNLAWFKAMNPKLGLEVGYLLHRKDFPWIGIWDEKYARTAPPWNRKTWTRGLEFATTPFPMSRRGILDMGKLFGTPCFRWIDARGEITATFVIYLAHKGTPDLFDHAVRFLNS